MIGDGAKAFYDAFQESIRPKGDLTVSEWADKHRVLDKTAAEPGLWDTSRTPYSKEIMDELSYQSRTQKVVFMKSAQIGGTEIGNNWLGYIASHDPNVTMIVWPSLPDVVTNVKLRITPLIENTPVIKKAIKDHKGRKEGSSASFKNFDGGAWVFRGSQSASGLRSIPSGNLFMDEIDGFVDDCQGEGCPVALLLVRSRTFPKRKAFLCSTPTFKGRSKIAREFRASDQRYFYIPCPHCDEYQVLSFDQISYKVEENKDSGDIVTECQYFCKHCGEEIPEHFKSSFLLKGEWRKHNPKSDVAGFHISGFYSPLGWLSWKEIAQLFVNAKTPELKKTFINTVLGEVYEEEGESPKFDSLYARRELYTIGTVPRGVIFLTASADIQKDRIEVQAMGHGKNRERWCIEHKVIPGQVSEDDVWNSLSIFIEGSFKHVDGHEMTIAMAGIDSGYETQRVYNFCKKYSPSKVIPLKGRDEMSTMIGVPQAVNLKSAKTGKKHKRGIRLWTVAVNMIKDEVYSDLMLSPPEDILDGFPAGFIHFPQYDQEYFRQLTAEKKILEKNKRGFTKAVYIKEYERNEILDLYVYNRAVSAIIGVDRLNESGWKRLEEQNKLAPKLKSVDNRKKDRKDRGSKKKKQISKFWDN